MKVEVELPSGEYCGDEKIECPFDEGGSGDCSFLKKQLYYEGQYPGRKYSIHIKHPDCPGLKEKE